MKTKNDNKSTSNYTWSLTKQFHVIAFANLILNK